VKTRRFLFAAGIGVGQALLIGAALYVYLHGWRRAIGVPFNFFFDGLFYLMQAKSTIDNGWWWFNPMIGAPFGLDELAFPANGNVDQLIVWIVSRFIHNPLAAINVSWVAMVMVSGPAASWCLRRLGVSIPSALVTGTLFALIPYALYKNIAHFGMAIYLVPFVCAAAVQIASGHLPERGYTRGPGAVLLAGSGLLAFNYVYYPFFACVLIAAASAVGYVTYREGRILRSGALFLAVLAACTFLNLAPSLQSWRREGKPIVLLDKVPAHAEIYGLKIRTLISPPFDHVFPPFQWWIQREFQAQFPLETENASSRLGFVATLGFLGLLAVVMVPTIVDRVPSRRTLLGAGALTLGAILLATIGGFGSLFNLLVSPEIRAYSRICPFIAFFAFAAVACAMDFFFTTPRRRVAAATIVLALGFIDQSGAAVPLNNDYPRIAAELAPLKRFVGQLESRLPGDAMVFQLPFVRTYMNEGTTSRMGPYDHFKPYLVSHHLRWSYPALSNRQVAWQESAAALSPQQLAYQLLSEGFAAIVIDRFAYDDDAAAITAEIRDEIGAQAVIADSGRYVGLDIRPLAGRPGASRPPLSREMVARTSGMKSCGGKPLMSIDQMNAIGVPFNGLPMRLRSSEALRVGGWAVDRSQDRAAAGVDVVVDQVPFAAIYGAERADVVEYFKRPSYRFSGFNAHIPASRMTHGQHMLTVRVIASDSQCYYQSPALVVVVE